jgi:hypothetical protein
MKDLVGIQVELDEKKVVCSIGVIWYNRNSCVISFYLSVSDDGVNFVKVLSRDSGKTRKKTTTLQMYPQYI